MAGSLPLKFSDLALDSSLILGLLTPHYQFVSRGDNRTVLGLDAEVAICIGAWQKPGGPQVSWQHVQDQGGSGRVADICILLPSIL